MRFGSVLCLPVWSFDGPSRQDGVLCGSQCEPTGLSQYPVFKVQAAADSLRILRFCPPLTIRSRSAARRYITHSPWCCQRVSLSFFRPRPSRPTQVLPSETRTPPELGREASKVRSIVAPLGGFLWFRLPIHALFQHTLQCLSRRPAVRCCTVPATARGCKGQALPLIYTRLHTDGGPAALPRARPPFSPRRPDARSGASPPADALPLLAYALTYIWQARLALRRS